MNIETLTIGEAKEIIRLFGHLNPTQPSFLKTGEKYLVRTVTMIFVGHLRDQNNHELLMADCSWIPETDRWADMLQNGTFNEVEPYPSDVVIPKAVIVDATQWLHDLPTEQK